MKFTTLLLSTAVIASLTTACKTQQIKVDQSGQVATATLAQTDEAIHELLYGSWTATNVDGKAVVGTDRPYIEFGSEASNKFLVRAYAYDGCNYLNGMYAVTPGGAMHRSNDFISTMRMCDGANYEIGVVNALNNVAKYTITKTAGGYTLTMLNAAGNELMQLARFNTDFLSGAWDVEAINGASVDNNLGLQLVIDMTDHTIHGNAGCNTLNGAVSTTPDSPDAVSFSKLVTTRMTCPAIATEQALLQALQSVVKLRPGQSANSVVLLDSEGHEALILTRTNL